MHYGMLIVVGAISVTAFLPQKTKLYRIPDEWIITLFASMHYGLLIVVGVISTIAFPATKDGAL